MTAFVDFLPTNPLCKPGVEHLKQGPIRHCHHGPSPAFHRRFTPGARQHTQRGSSELYKVRALCVWGVALGGWVSASRNNTFLSSFSISLSRSRVSDRPRTLRFIFHEVRTPLQSLTLGIESLALRFVFLMMIMIKQVVRFIE
jgi:hypothetical protein